ncbi:hypothetical protein T05_13054 [Trichinella murrelli]|uniref:Uncharacterized protein n=1 Tax=Trichinella murrelli TaxID=144512 RepID=A0A0V0SQG4_9BILA|nr:hypothetical protein T05_13054 [Trichinella murrelli]
MFQKSYFKKCPKVCYTSQIPAFIVQCRTKLRYH